MSTNQILLAVTKASGLRLSDLMGSPRPRAASLARGLACALIRELVEPTPSYMAIVLIFGLRHHRSAAYAITAGEGHPLYTALLAQLRPAAVPCAE